MLNRAGHLGSAQVEPVGVDMSTANAINDNPADVIVRGLGFTGLATAVAAARSGFRVIGLDESAERVRDIADVRPGCGLTTVSELELRAHLRTGMLEVGDLPAAPPSAG